MRLSRFAVTVFVLLLALGTTAVGVTVDGAAATHGEAIGEDAFLEVQTFTNRGTPPGEVEVTLEYHLNDNLTGFDVVLNNTDIANVTALNGFSKADGPNRYEWDGQTTQPRLRVRIAANESHPERPRYSFVDTGEWALTQIVRTKFSWSFRGDVDNDWRRVVETNGRGIAGDEFVYLGGYDRHDFGSSEEHVRLVVGENADPNQSAAALEETLLSYSNTLNVGEYSNPVTAFIITKPIFRGGRASGAGGHDFYARDDTLPPGETVLPHEYVHTRQNYSTDASTEWTREAEARYYGHLLAVQQGQIEYSHFHREFSSYSTRYPDVVLAHPGTWRGSTAHYNLGGLAIAALDARIRNETDGNRSYQDVLRAKNNHEGPVSLSDMEAFASEAAGTDMTGFFQRHVRARTTELAVPPPSALDLPDTEKEFQAGAPYAYDIAVVRSNGSYQVGDEIVVTAILRTDRSVRTEAELTFAVNGTDVATKTTSLEGGVEEPTFVRFTYKFEEPGEYSFTVNGVEPENPSPIVVTEPTAGAETQGGAGPGFGTGAGLGGLTIAAYVLKRRLAPG